jgi:hypothetical protein
VIREHPLDTLAYCFVVADMQHTRIRRPLPSEPSA